jgi:hypothetical protein
MNEQSKSWEHKRWEKEIKEQALYNNFMLNVAELNVFIPYDASKTKQIFNILDFMSL